MPNTNSISCCSVAAGLVGRVDTRDDTDGIVLRISEDLRPDRGGNSSVARTVQDDNAVRILLGSMAASNEVGAASNTTLEVISENGVLVTTNEVDRREHSLVIREARDCANDRDLVGWTDSVGTDIDHGSTETYTRT